MARAARAPRVTPMPMPALAPVERPDFLLLRGSCRLKILVLITLIEAPLMADATAGGIRGVGGLV